MSNMNPVQVPELLCEIAAHLTDPRDILHLAQSDQFTHGMVLPFLFHEIEIPLASVSSLAAVLRKSPELATTCRSLVFCRERGDDADADENKEMDDAVYAPLYDDLCTILGALSMRAQLRRLSLNWVARRYLGRDTAFPARVWDAITSASVHLQVLEMSVEDHEKDNWNVLMMTTLPHLRVLHLTLSAHGWRCEHVQAFLDRHPALEDLVLDFPTCCGPKGVTLSSTFPNLTSFALTASDLTETESDFLVRHPALARLCLDTEQVFSLPPGGVALQALQALSVKSYFQHCLPSFSTVPVVHLRLCRLSDLSAPDTVNALRSVGHTLRCLELDGFSADALPALLTHFRELLALAPRLAEFALMSPDVWPQQPTWTPADLRAILTALTPAPALIAIRLVDGCGGGAPLPSAVLADLGPIPNTLRYIHWEVDRVPVTYAVERREGRNVAHALAGAPFPRIGDWTAESVLDHLGESVE